MIDTRKHWRCSPLLFDNLDRTKEALLTAVAKETHADVSSVAWPRFHRSVRNFGSVQVFAWSCIVLVDMEGLLNLLFQRPYQVDKVECLSLVFYAAAGFCQS